MGSQLIHGVVSDEKCQAECHVLAETETLGKLRSYTQFVVVEAPDTLPDGIYRISFGDFTGYTRKLDGLWLPQGIGAEQIPDFPDSSGQ